MGREHFLGKGEIARYEQFLLFPQSFQKACFPGASKGVIVWEWVNHVHPQISSSPNVLVLWLCSCSFGLLGHYYCLIFKLKISYIVSLEKCHTSAFNALIIMCNVCNLSAENACISIPNGKI